MQVFVMFHFNGEASPAVVTVVEGDISDVLLPSVGDIIQHADSHGLLFEGTVTERRFLYSVQHGRAANGSVAVTLCLDRKN